MNIRYEINLIYNKKLSHEDLAAMKVSSCFHGFII